MLALSFSFTLAQSCQSSEIRQGETNFILVRHAEKATGEDPHLTPAGKLRAQALMERLKGTKLSAVYSTNFNRTQETAAPSAQQHRLSVTPYNPRDLPSFAKELKQQHQGETVLIVGHSNSTPSLANLLAGKEELNNFSEDDYGNIVQVVVSKKGRASMKVKRY